MRGTVAAHTLENTHGPWPCAFTTQLDLPSRDVFLAAAADGWADEDEDEAAWRHPPADLPPPPELEPVDDLANGGCGCHG